MTPPSNLIHNLGLNLHPKMPKSASLAQIFPIASEIHLQPIPMKKGKKWPILNAIPFPSFFFYVPLTP